MYQKRPTKMRIPGLMIWCNYVSNKTDETVLLHVKKRPIAYQKRPVICQKRPLVYQKRPIICQKRPTSEHTWARCGDGVPRSGITIKISLLTSIFESKETCCTWNLVSQMPKETCSRSLVSKETCCRWNLVYCLQNDAQSDLDVKRHLIRRQTRPNKTSKET